MRCGAKVEARRHKRDEVMMMGLVVQRSQFTKGGYSYLHTLGVPRNRAERAHKHAYVGHAGDILLSWRASRSHAKTGFISGPWG